MFTHLYNSFFYGLAYSKYKPGRAISACVPHKILDDLTQKPTKLIRTELVKMTSEASLPTDLKNIHQTVYRSRRNDTENEMKWLFLHANRTRRLTAGK